VTDEVLTVSWNAPVTGHMVNPEARKKVAAAIRQFCSGEITSIQFDEMWCALEKEMKKQGRWDEGLFRIHTELMWYFDFLCEERFSDWPESQERRGRFERAALFLETDLGYEWPHLPDPIFPMLSRQHIRSRAHYVGAIVLLGLVPLLAGLTSFRSTTVVVLALVFLLAVWDVADSVSNMRRRKRAESTGDISVWPFLSDAQYSEALGTCAQQGVAREFRGRP